jgi:hypothetical protein
MKKKKLTKASYKKILPAELYKNLREKKKGQGNSLLTHYCLPLTLDLKKKPIRN